jgi:hypothetical protein
VLRIERITVLALVAVAVAHSAVADTTGCVSDPGSVVLESTSTLTLEMIGTTPCTQYDRYSVGGALSLQGGTLDVTLGNGFVPVAGDSFQILTWGTLSGTFGTVTLPALSAGLTWSTSALYTSGTISVTSQSANTEAPLPVWALGALGTGLIGIASRRMRKRRRAPVIERGDRNVA